MAFGSSSVEFRVIATLQTGNNASNIASAKTTTNGGVTIDETTSGLAALSRGTYTLMTTGNDWGFGDVTSGAAMVKESGGETHQTTATTYSDGTAVGIKFSFELPAAWTTTAGAKIYLPLANSESPHAFYVKSSAYEVMMTTKTGGTIADACASGETNELKSTASAVAMTASAGTTSALGDIYVKASATNNLDNSAGASGDFMCVIVSELTTTDVSGIAKNPLVTNNQSTHYELYYHLSNLGVGSDENHVKTV